MKASPFLDEIRDEVWGEEARAVLLRLGRRKFGAEPSKKQQKARKAITDLGLSPLRAFLPLILISLAMTFSFRE
jgi:hypothetical protein